MAPNGKTAQVYRSFLGAGFVFVALCSNAWGQFVYTESFGNDSAAGWVFIQEDTTPGPRLTSGLTPDAVDPEFGQPQIDSSGQGWLRMATTTGNQANAAYLNIALPAAGAKVTVEFDFAFWDGAGNPGDGVAFFLSDANVAFNAGAYGGSLGYAQKTGIDGLAGGYVGMGLDVYGNYPNPTEGRIGGSGFDPNNVTVRGPGNGQLGYDFVASADLDTVVGGSNDNLGFASYTARPDQDAVDYRHAIFTLNADSTYTVQLQFGFESAPVTVLSGTLAGTRPDEFRLGFTSGTGGATQVYELKNLEVQIDGGTNGYYWDDDNGNNLWNTGANWNPNGTPGAGATVYFTDSFANVDSPETVNLNGNRSIGSAVFSGAKEYTLINNTLTFDAPGSSTTSRIQIFNNPNGNAEHTITSAIVLNNNLEILHQIEKEFTISGTVNLGGNNLLVDTASSTLLSGVISGSGGTITKNGDGTLTLSGANTYTGATTINNGILEARNNTALGSTAGGVVVNNGGTLALANNITIGNEALTLNGTGEGGRGALLNLSGTNTYGGGITLGSASTIASEGGALTLSGAISAGSALTFDTDSGSSITSNGIISGAGTLTKTGTGTLTLAGANTYSGLTTISEGTARVTNAAGLGADSGDTVVASGATLELAGGITISDNEALTISGLGVSGKAALWSDSGSNLWNSDIAVTGGSASFGAAAGATLRIDGAISGANQDVIITGAGTVNFEEPMTYTGDTLVQSGTLRFVGNNRVADATDVVVSAGAILDLNDNNDTVGSIAGAGSIDLGTGTLTTGGNNVDTTFSGVISGASGDVIKTGSGTMTLSGANTFTGLMQVNAGTVRATSANTLANTATLVMNGGTYAIAGVADTVGVFDLNASSTMDFEGSAGGLLSFGSVANTPTGTLSIENWIGSPFTTTASTTTGFFLNSGSITANMTALANATDFIGWGTNAGWKTVTAGSQYELVPVITAGAGVFRWDRDTSTAWATGTNWVGNPAGGPNAIGDLAYFGDDAPNNAQTPIISDGNKTLGTMILNGTGNRSYTVNASGADRTLTFESTGNTAYLTVAGTQTNVIGGSDTANQRVNISLNDALLIQNNSTNAAGLTLGTLNGAHTLALNANSVTVMGTSKTLIHSQVTGTGAITKNGPGILELTDASNSFSGGVNLNAGTVQIGSNAALGTGTFTIDGTAGAEIQATRTAVSTTRTITNALDVNNFAQNTLKFTGSEDLIFSGTQSIDTTGTQLTIDVATGRNLTFDTNKDLTGTGSIIKAGTGTLTLRGNDSTFSGGLSVDAGTVTAGTSGAGALASGITIGATATGQNYLGTGEVTVNAGGTLTTFQNASALGHDFTIGNTGVLNNTGGTITITNSTAADLNAHLALNGTINNSGGTTSFVDWNDMNVSDPAAINVTGGTLNFNLRDDFNNTNPNSNALNITVNGGALNVTLANDQSNSTFVLGTDDTLTLNGASSSMSINTGAAANLVTLDGRVNLQNGSTLTVTQGTTVLSSSTILDGGSGVTKGTLEVRGDLSVNEPGVANSPNLTINNSGNTQITAPNAGSSITNLGTVTKTGAGITTINANVNNIEASRIVINQGTLLNGTSNQIDNSTKITLGGGTYDTNGYDEIVGSLTLSAYSTIDLDGAAADSILKFDQSSSEAWTGGASLAITGWSGSASGGGTDQVYFGNSSSGLTTGQLGQIHFVNPLGFAPGIYGAMILSTGEVVPYIPETSTALAAVMLMSVAFRRGRLRRTL